MRAYIEHAAYFVHDIDWYLKFFEEIFEMTCYRQRETEGLRECWLRGGVQLCEVKENQGNGRCAHLCLLVNGLEELREKALAMGAEPMAKHHWLQLPDGLQLELFEAAEGAVETMNGVEKRAPK